MRDDKWTDSFLDRYKQFGDHEGDEMMTKLEVQDCLDSVNDALQALTVNDQALPSDLPEDLKIFFDQTASLPAWADSNKIALAQQFFTTHGPVFGVVLLCGSLPVLYAGGLGGAQVLAATGQLTNHYERRAGETLRFILDLMEPGGLASNGKGVRTAQKVRLMHAAIRYYAKKSPEAWPAKPEWGAPINQVELVGTLLAFSTKALEGLEKMGVSVTETETEAYFHTWKVVGHLLGIQPEIIPETVQSSKVLWDRIAATNFIRTDAGLTLAKAHVAFLKKVIPGELFDGIALSLMRYLMGRKLVEEVLGLPKPGWTYLLLGFIRGLFGLKELLMDSSRTIEQIVQEDSIHFMEGLERHWTVNDSTPFRIPPSLTKK